MYIDLADLVLAMETFTEITYLDDCTGKIMGAKGLEHEDKERFILIPKFDNEKITRDYIEQMDDHQHSEYLLSRCDEPDFGHFFHVFVNDEGLYYDYIEFSGNEANRIAMEWCNRNNIKYTT